MTGEEIDNIVMNILPLEGPDMHIDGHEEIAAAFAAYSLPLQWLLLLEGNHFNFKRRYLFAYDFDMPQ